MSNGRRSIARMMLMAVIAIVVAIVPAFTGMTGVVISLVAAAIVAAVAGGAACRVRETSTAACWEAVSHGFPFLMPMIACYFALPRLKEGLMDVGAELDDLTRAAIQISDAIVNYWYVLLPPIGFMLLADLGVFHLLHRNEPTRWVARLWSATITLGVVAALLALASTVYQASVTNRGFPAHSRMHNPTGLDSPLNSVPPPQSFK